MAPDKVVVPAAFVVRFLMPVKFASIAVMPLKLRVKSWPAPVTPAEKVGVVPVSVVSAPRTTSSL